MRRSALGSVLLLTAAVAVASAQVPKQWPLAPVPPEGQRVAPFFDGFYENADGTITLSFGFSNFNKEETVEIPLGPDNFIEPAQYNGMQPEHFRVVNYGGFSGPRERGTFAVTVPPDFQGDVVWTIRSPNGSVNSVPGRARSVAYELGLTPQAAGSLRPLVRLAADGPVGWGPLGIVKAEGTDLTSTLNAGFDRLLLGIGAIFGKEGKVSQYLSGTTQTAQQAFGTVQQAWQSTTDAIIGNNQAAQTSGEMAFGAVAAAAQEAAATVTDSQGQAAAAATDPTRERATADER